MGQTPTSGNVLIAVIGTQRSSSSTERTVDSITETGVSWGSSSQIDEHSSSPASNVEIWFGIVSSGASPSISIALSGSADGGAVADICEYSGIATTSYLDRTQVNTATTTPTSTGTTALATTQPYELWIGGITVGAARAQSGATNGFTLLDGVAYSSTSVAYLEKIVSATGTAYSGTTVSPATRYAGCIATFRAAHAISLTPATGNVGSSVSVSGSGLVATHSITATFNSAGVTLSGTTSTDSSGSFTGATFTVPASTSGAKTVVINDGTNSPSASYTVTSAISLNPTGGLVGSTVTVTGTGMVGSHTGCTATFGGNPVTLNTPNTNSAGGLTATFTVPVSTLGGKAVVVSDGTNLPSATYTVNPSALHHFVISVPASAISGTSFGSVAVTAYDVNNNVKTDYVGLVYFQSSDAGATLPYTSTSKYTFQAGDIGTHTFSGFTLVHGPSQTLTVTDGSISVTSSAITVSSSAFDHFVVSAPGSVSAGTAFSLTVTAKDASGNTVTSYSGSVGLTASSGSVSPASTGTSGWVSGVWTSSSVTLTTVGSVTITANDGSGHTGVSGSIAVSPGVLDHFVFATIDSPQYAGMGFSVTVTAFDANNNVKTDWTGSVSLTASNGGSVLPSSLNIASGGAVTGAVSVSKTGTGVTLGASAGGKSGTSEWL